MSINGVWSLLSLDLMELKLLNSYCVPWETYKKLLLGLQNVDDVRTKNMFDLIFFMECGNPGS